MNTEKTIIFLDIDGVLATDSEFMRVRHKFWEKYDVAKRLQIPYPFNKGCVKIFNEICDECNVDIVISSDWKMFFTLSDLNEIFKFNGIKQMTIDTTKPLNTPKYSMMLEQERMNEINNYISENKIKKYVIIDDLDLDKIIGEGHKDIFVKTRSNEGLKQTNVKEKIIKLCKN